MADIFLTLQNLQACKDGDYNEFKMLHLMFKLRKNDFEHFCLILFKCGGLKFVLPSQLKYINMLTHIHKMYIQFKIQVPPPILLLVDIQKQGLELHKIIIDQYDLKNRAI